MLLFHVSSQRVFVFEFGLAVGTGLLRGGKMFLDDVLPHIALVAHFNGAAATMVEITRPRPMDFSYEVIGISRVQSQIQQTLNWKSKTKEKPNETKNKQFLN